MKSYDYMFIRNHIIVAPLVGAWIEIKKENSTKRPDETVAPLVGAWIEIAVNYFVALVAIVAPLVGAWIEIY